MSFEAFDWGIRHGISEHKFRPPPKDHITPQQNFSDPAEAVIGEYTFRLEELMSDDEDDVDEEPACHQQSHAPALQLSKENQPASRQLLCEPLTKLLSKGELVGHHILNEPKRAKHHRRYKAPVRQLSKEGEQAWSQQPHAPVLSRSSQGKQTWRPLGPDSPALLLSEEIQGRAVQKRHESPNPPPNGSPTPSQSELLANLDAALFESTENYHTLEAANDSMVADQLPLGAAESSQTLSTPTQSTPMVQEDQNFHCSNTASTSPSTLRNSSPTMTAELADVNSPSPTAESQLLKEAFEAQQAERALTNAQVLLQQPLHAAAQERGKEGTVTALEREHERELIQIKKDIYRWYYIKKERDREVFHSRSIGVEPRPGLEQSVRRAIYNQRLAQIKYELGERYGQFGIKDREAKQIFAKELLSRTVRDLEAKLLSEQFRLTLCMDGLDYLFNIGPLGNRVWSYERMVKAAKRIRNKFAHTNRRFWTTDRCSLDMVAEINKINAEDERLDGDRSWIAA